MSKKKQKQKLTPWSLGSLPTTPVAIKNPDYETDKELKARLQREEAAERQAADPIYQQQQVTNKTMSELRKYAAAFWSRPIADIVKELYTESAKDVTFSVPQTKSHYELADAQHAFQTWSIRHLRQVATSLLKSVANVSSVSEFRRAHCVGPT
jgi:hypothetical protein